MLEVARTLLFSLNNFLFSRLQRVQNFHGIITHGVALGYYISRLWR